MSDSASPASPSSSVTVDGQVIRLPLNLGLNDGTYMPAACVEVLQAYARNERLALRNYSVKSEHDALRAAIAKADGVTPEHVYLHNGSGPILKQVVPYLIAREIRSSPTRVMKHLITKSAFPIVTPRITYGKVPSKAHKQGLAVQMLDMGPENGFRVDPNAIAARLEKSDAFVYLVNPNNPTGNLIIDRSELEPLLKRFPRSRFWIDEAYVHFADPEEHRPMSDLVVDHPNLFVTRTFSFAYGMAAARIGYLLTQPALVKEFWGQLTDYRLGTLQEDLAMAALSDPDHLPFMRSFTRAQIAILRQGMGQHAGVETFPSISNFVLGRFTDGRTGEDLKARMLKRGIKIKELEPFIDQRYDEYFRMTLGTAAENRFYLDTFAAVMHDWRNG